MSINSDSEITLRELYDRCCKETNIKPGELLNKTLSSTKNTIYSGVTGSSLEVPINQDIQSLLDENYIRKFKGVRITITAKGVWYIEEKFYSGNIEKLIDSFDKKYFQVQLEKMPDNNKILLLGTICAHAFSDKCGISYLGLNNEHFISLMRSSFNLLKPLHLVKASTFEEFLDSNNHQKTKSAKLTNKVDILSKATYSIFISRNNSYYLNLVKDGKLDLKNLKVVLELVFGSVPIDSVDLIVDKMRSISLDYSYIFSKNSEISEQDANDAIQQRIEEIAGL